MEYLRSVWLYPNVEEITSIASCNQGLRASADGKRQGLRGKISSPSCCNLFMCVCETSQILKQASFGTLPTNTPVLIILIKSSQLLLMRDIAVKYQSRLIVKGKIACAPVLSMDPSLYKTECQEMTVHFWSLIQCLRTSLYGHCTILHHPT